MSPSAQRLTDDPEKEVNGLSLFTLHLGTVMLGNDREKINWLLKKYKAVPPLACLKMPSYFPEAPSIGSLLDFVRLKWFKNRGKPHRDCYQVN